jgi:hypothetical protein
MMAPMDVLAWLLDGDPTIRYQALRDLTDADEATLAMERARIPDGGLAAAILQRQEPDGVWRCADEPDWLPTLFNAVLLRRTDIDPNVAEPAMARLATGFRWADEFGALPFFDGEVEPCINGHALTVGSYFGRPSERLAQRLLGDQLADGGWYCDAPTSRCASYHSTICVLEGLLAYERAVGGDAAISEARRCGESYLVDRGMFRRRSTGAVAHADFTTFAFPPRYHYDVLRGLDHLRDAGAVPDARLTDAIRVVEQRRQPDGRWPLDRSHPDGLAFTWPEAVGEPSRWNTLRALRVLRWYERR